MANDLLMRLLAMNLAASAAILTVLTLRKLARAALGARTAYALWLAVPTVMVAGLLPPRTISLPAPPPPAVAPVATKARADVVAPAAPAPASVRAAPTAAAPTFVTSPMPSLSQILVGVWLSGVAVSLILLGAGQRRALAQFGSLVPDAQDPTVARASNPNVGPALLGTVRPRVAIPADFEARFDATERELILAHERTHLASGHAVINAFVALLKAVHWFNPLVHMGARCARVDQELACDAAVIERFPSKRYAYAQALLKTQLAFATLPLGCDWPMRSPSRLEERLGMLAQKTPGSLRLRVGACAVAALTACAGLAAWASEPPVTKIAPAARPAPDALGARPPAPAPLARQHLPPEAQSSAIAAMPTSAVARPAEQPAPADGSMPAQTEPAKPIVLAAIEPALPAVPEVASPDVGKQPQVVADLSQATPGLTVLNTASTSPPTGDWGLLESLAGKDYSGNVNGGVGIIRFRKRANNTYTIIFGMVGEQPTTVALKLISKNVAAMSYVTGPNWLRPGWDPYSYRVYIKGDGLIMDWGRSPCPSLQPSACAGGDVFIRLVNGSGAAITTLSIADGNLIENQQSKNGGRIVFSPIAGSRPAVSREAPRQADAQELIAATNLAPIAPHPAVLRNASTSQSTGDWGILQSLSGKFIAALF